MLLQRIVLERFRQLDGREVILRPGLNLVKGPNEAGKTSLQEAILFALLGNPRHTTLERTKGVDDHVTWGQGRRFCITLDFAGEDGTAYRLRKDWDGQTACLTDLQTGEEDDDADSVQQAVAGMLGQGSLKLLQGTLCVEQDAIADIAAGRKEIGDHLQGIVTGGGAEEATVSAVLGELDAKIAEMKRGWQTAAPRNPGPIKVKRDEIAGLEEWLSRVRPQVEQVGQAREQAVALEARIKEASEELDARRSLRDLCDRRLEWEGKQKSWGEQERELEARIEQIREAQRQIDGAGEPAVEQAGPRSPVPLVVAGIGGLLLLAGVVTGVLGLVDASDSALVVVGALLGLPGLLACAGGLAWFAATMSQSRSVGLGAARARLDVLLGGETPEALEEKRRDASRRRRDAEEALESAEMQRAAGVTPIEHEKLRQDVERLEGELGEKKEELVRCQARCEAVGDSVQDVHRLEEQRAAAERSLAHLEEWLSVCQVARDVIGEAKEQTMRSARDDLEPRIGRYLGAVTQGRYDSVEAGDDLNLRVFSREKGDWLAPDDGELSRGAVDQLYLAARLALIDLFYRDARPPLLLDDPFVKFDPGRREQAMALCKEIARRHQVVLLTCHDDYDGMADHVVEL
jgi:DNA repair exonuclease SbcCD ATPase subunit